MHGAGSHSIYLGIFEGDKCLLCSIGVPGTTPYSISSISGLKVRGSGLATPHMLQGPLMCCQGWNSGSPACLVQPLGPQNCADLCLPGILGIRVGGICWSVWGFHAPLGSRQGHLAQVLETTSRMIGGPKPRYSPWAALLRTAPASDPIWCAGAWHRGPSRRPCPRLLFGLGCF